MKQSIFGKKSILKQSTKTGKATMKITEGGFKFYVQRTNDGADVHKLQEAWENSYIF